MGIGRLVGGTALALAIALAAALLAHEEGHLDIGRELVRLVEEDLTRVPPAADCRALDAAVRARYDTLLKGFSARDKEYDQRTQHGRTQGAVFR